jgi:hypothetical protein
MTQALFDADEKIVPGPVLRPKDAATLIIVRRDRDGMRVLMGQRHARMAFQPNKFVFPGGRIDPCDQRISVGGELHVRAASHLLPFARPSRKRVFSSARNRTPSRERARRPGSAIFRTASCRGSTDSC